MAPSLAVPPGDALPPDDRSPVAIAAEWSSRIMTIALEMVLPGVAGAWLDKRLGTRFVFTLLGFGLGMTAALWHLTNLVQPVRQVDGRPGAENQTTPPTDHPTDHT